MSGELPLAASGELAAQPPVGAVGRSQAAESFGGGWSLREAAANSLIVAIFSPFLALGSAFVSRFLLAVVVFDIPLQFGTHLYYREEDAALGALGGLSISVTTIALAGLYASQIIAALARRKREGLRRVEINLPLAIYVAFSVLSLFAAQDIGLSFFEVFLNVQMYLLFFYIANFIRTRQEVLYLVSLLLSTVILESTINIILSFTGMPTTIWGIPAHIYVYSGSQQGFMRVGGTLGSPNQTAGFFSLLLVPAASVLFTRLGSAYKWAARAVLGLGVVALIFTYSRGGWIAFALSMMLLCLLIWHRRGLSLKAPIIIILVLTLIYLPFHGAISARLLGDDHGSAESRIPLMRLAFRMIGDNPVLGVGSNNFQLVMYHYLTSEFREGFRYAVHNKYLLVLAETGVLGFLAYFVFLLGILRTAWRCWKLRDPVFSPLALGFMAAFAGHMVHMSVEVFRGRPITQLVWLLAGLLIAMHRLCARPPAAESVSSIA